MPIYNMYRKFVEHFIIKRCYPVNISYISIFAFDLMTTVTGWNTSHHDEIEQIEQEQHEINDIKSQSTANHRAKNETYLSHFCKNEKIEHIQWSKDSV